VRGLQPPSSRAQTCAACSLRTIAVRWRGGSDADARMRVRARISMGSGAAGMVSSHWYSSGLLLFAQLLLRLTHFRQLSSWLVTKVLTKVSFAKNLFLLIFLPFSGLSSTFVTVVGLSPARGRGVPSSLTKVAFLGIFSLSNQVDAPSKLSSRVMTKVDESLTILFYSMTCRAIEL
jgi:hypothetical protein